VLSVLALFVVQALLARLRLGLPEQGLTFRLVKFIRRMMKNILLVFMKHRICLTIRELINLTSLFESERAKKFRLKVKSAS